MPRYKTSAIDVDCSSILAADLNRECSAASPLGFCVDIGAPRSVVGLRELNRLLTATNTHKKHIRRSSNRFRFGDQSFESLGCISLPLPTPRGVHPIVVDFDIVKAHVPPLLGMDVLDREELVADTVFRRLARRSTRMLDDGATAYVDDWYVPLVRSQSGHVYVPFDRESRCLFTRAQLHKLHKQFFHPSATKLFNLMKRARPEHATPETLEILKDISRRCDPCQRIKPAPTRFRVSFGSEHVRFNERILMDVMYLGNSPVLHIVDDGTKFSAARFLPDMSTQTIWETLMQCWASIYTGLPNRILVDQGSNMGKSEPFISLAARANVEVQFTGTEAHSSLGAGERYHEPLRTVMRKLNLDFPGVNKSLLLQMAVKAANDTLGPEGLVPSSLVFGELPRIYTPSETPERRDTLGQRAALVHAARTEMQKLMAQMRIARGLRHTVPPAANNNYDPGDQVLVWREKIVNSRIGEWLGPYTVLGMNAEKKLVYIQDAKVGAARPFSVTQVKRYILPVDVAHSFFQDIGRGLQYFTSPADDDNSVFLTEVLDPTDPRTSSIQMTTAKRAEIRGLLERGTFRIILREEVPPDANVLPGRFVLAIKSTEDGETKFKARYVIGGHRDRMKAMMVHSAATLQPQSIRLLLALAAAFGFDIWSADVRQAYLQSSEALSRDIFITKPVAEFELQPEECLKLLKPLYGLCDSGDLWHKTLDDHHRRDLGMTPFRSDPALYRLMANGLLTGLSGGYVDDLLRAGTPEFKRHAAQTNDRFEMGPDETLPCTFSGFHLSRDESGTLQQNQHFYLRKLEQLPLDAKFQDFRSMRMKLAWLANTRPDCQFEISQLAQVTEERFSIERSSIIRRLNKATKFAVDNQVSLRVPQLDVDSLRVVGFSDASFANNYDLSTQLGHIMFLADKTGKSVPIHFKSYKSRRVVRSAMAGEVIAFSDLFDVAAALSSELKLLLDREVPVHLFTDSKSLFDVISKGSRTSEKRTMLDIAAAREGFRDKVISDIGFVRSSHNIADGLTKSMSQAALQNAVSSGELNVVPEQWIVRD